jgi:hypothetical protein
MRNYNNFYTFSFCAWATSREKKREIGVEASMEGEF